MIRLPLAPIRSLTVSSFYDCLKLTRKALPHCCSIVSNDDSSCSFETFALPGVEEYTKRGEVSKSTEDTTPPCLLRSTIEEETRLKQVGLDASNHSTASKPGAFSLPVPIVVPAHSLAQPNQGVYEQGAKATEAPGEREARPPHNGSKKSCGSDDMSTARHTAANSMRMLDTQLSVEKKHAQCGRTLATSLPTMKKIVSESAKAGRSFDIHTGFVAPGTNRLSNFPSQGLQPDDGVLLSEEPTPATDRRPSCDQTARSGGEAKNWVRILDQAITGTQINTSSRVPQAPLEHQLFECWRQREMKGALVQTLFQRRHIPKPLQSSPPVEIEKSSTSFSVDDHLEAQLVDIERERAEILKELRTAYVFEEEHEERPILAAQVLEALESRGLLRCFSTPIGVLKFDARKSCQQSNPRAKTQQPAYQRVNPRDWGAGTGN